MAMEPFGAIRLLVEPRSLNRKSTPVVGRADITVVTLLLPVPVRSVEVLGDFGRSLLAAGGTPAWPALTNP